MPVTPTYPGVYVEELPSAVRTIAGVSTSTTAFVGRALKGEVDTPVIIHSFAEFESVFGGLLSDAPMSFSVDHYFANGGSEAVIVRVASGATAAQWLLGGVTLVASSPGKWANTIVLRADNQTDPVNTSTINLIVRDTASPVPLETLRNVSLDPVSPRFITNVLKFQSSYLRTSGVVPATFPGGSLNTDVVATPGSDGIALAGGDIEGNEGNRTGMYALLKTDIFNILCVPPAAPGLDIPAPTWGKAATLCLKRRAMLLVDAPDVPLATVKTSAPALISGDGQRNAAVFYPRIRVANPLKAAGMLDDFVPSGAVAGVFARTDAQRGVWKAPAGLETGLSGVQALTRLLDDDQNGELNPLGINCLRTFPLAGSVVWGARTMKGADKLADQWKYIPVRRIALYIEESLYRGTQWVVFEPNDEPLWAQIRLNVGAFMHNLFRQGAFQGSTPRDAYFVRCSSETTTQYDIDRGIVNILVGFAPLKPAEFVIIGIQQKTASATA